MKMIDYCSNILLFQNLAFYKFNLITLGGNIINTYLSKKIKIISTISTIMVVYLHSYNLNTTFLNSATILKTFNLNSFIQEFITNGITRVAVPLFFSIAGYLFFLNFTPSLNNFLIKYKKRFFSLLVPFLFWSILGILFYYLLQSIPFPQKIISNDLVKDYSFNKIIKTIFLKPIPYQLWFMVELIKFIIISPLIYFYISKLSYFSILPFLLFWFFNVDILVTRNDGILFFIFGSFLAIKEFNIDLSKIKYKIPPKFFLIVWVFILFTMTYLTLKGFSNINCLRKINIIIGTLTVWFNYDTIIQNKWIEDKLLYLSSFNLFIYVTHEPILSIFKRMILKFIGISSYTNLFVYLTLPIFIIILSIITATILGKNACSFYKIIIGGRSNNTTQIPRENITF